MHNEVDLPMCTKLPTLTMTCADHWFHRSHLHREAAVACGVRDQPLEQLLLLQPQLLLHLLHVGDLRDGKAAQCPGSPWSHPHFGAVEGLVGPGGPNW